MVSDARREAVERALTWLLAAALVVSVAGVIFVAVTPTETTEPYTEFYILGPEGNASGYPTNLSVGETGAFIVGITNHEHREMEYTVVVATNRSVVTTRTITVADEVTWQDRVTFTPTAPGRVKLRILLYRGTEATPSAPPYRRLRLWIDVRPAPS